MNLWGFMALSKNCTGYNMYVCSSFIVGNGYKLTFSLIVETWTFTSGKVKVRRGEERKEEKSEVECSTV